MSKDEDVGNSLRVRIPTLFSLSFYSLVRLKEKEDAQAF